MLLLVETGASLPEGERWWCPFTQFNTVDNIYESDHALCFIPNENVKIIGVGFFRIFSGDASSQDMSMYWKIYDESNSTKLIDSELRSIKLKHDYFKPDDNKVMKFNFVKDYEKGGVR